MKLLCCILLHKRSVREETNWILSYLSLSDAEWGSWQRCGGGTHDVLCILVVVVNVVPDDDIDAYSWILESDPHL